MLRNDAFAGHIPMGVVVADGIPLEACRIRLPLGDSAANFRRQFTDDLGVVATDFEWYAVCNYPSHQYFSNEIARSGAG